MVAGGRELIDTLWNVNVKKVDTDEWEYQIKTTGELFSGDKSGVLNLISQIKKLIEGGE